MTDKNIIGGAERSRRPVDPIMARVRMLRVRRNTHEAEVLTLERKLQEERDNMAHCARELEQANLDLITEIIRRLDRAEA